MNHYQCVVHILCNDTLQPLSPVISMAVYVACYWVFLLLSEHNIYMSWLPIVLCLHHLGFPLHYKKGISDDVWNDCGCRAVEYESGCVLCLCDHLTHIAIILSPGVQVRERERERERARVWN